MQEQHASKKPGPKRQLLKFLLFVLLGAEPHWLASPDKAWRINIFYLSVAAGAEWCCQIVQRWGWESGYCRAVSFFFSLLPLSKGQRGR